MRNHIKIQTSHSNSNNKQQNLQASSTASKSHCWYSCGRFTCKNYEGQKSRFLSPIMASRHPNKNLYHIHIGILSIHISLLCNFNLSILHSKRINVNLQRSYFLVLVIRRLDLTFTVYIAQKAWMRNMNKYIYFQWH